MAEEKGSGYTVINVKVQEPWEKGQKPPVGIRQAVDKEGNALDFYEVRVPRGVKVNGEKVGNATFTIPASCVKDIDPTNEHAKDYEKAEGFAETHKKIVAGNDFEVTFVYQNKNKETGEYEKKEVTKATLGQYKNALAQWKKEGEKYRAENKEYKNPEHDNIAAAKEAAEVGAKEVARAPETR